MIAPRISICPKEARDLTVFTTKKRREKCLFQEKNV
jgi:hypothetical protein